MSIIAVIALWSATPIIQDEDSRKNLVRCSNQMNQLIKAMYNYAISKSELAGSFPLKKGPAFWAILVESGEIDDEQMLRCPVTKRKYTGPRSNSNVYRARDPMSMCEHRDKVVWVAKSGDVHITDRGSDMHKLAMEKTVGFFAWSKRGTTWTYKPTHEDGKPIRIEMKETLVLENVKGALMETSGGDLKEPIQEKLYLIKSGVHMFGRKVGTRSISMKLSEDDSKKIEAWLLEVGSEEFSVREKATAELAKRYAFARKQIDQALSKADPEVRARLKTIRRTSVHHAPAKILYPLKERATWKNALGETYEVIESEDVKTPLGTFRGWKIRITSKAGASEIVWSDEMHAPVAIYRLKDGKRASGWVLDTYATGK